MRSNHFYTKLESKDFYIQTVNKDFSCDHIYDMHNKKTICGLKIVWRPVGNGFSSGRFCKICSKLK